MAQGPQEGAQRRAVTVVSLLGGTRTTQKVGSSRTVWRGLLGKLVDLLPCYLCGAWFAWLIRFLVLTWSGGLPGLVVEQPGASEDVQLKLGTVAGYSKNLDDKLIALSPSSPTHR